MSTTPSPAAPPTPRARQAAETAERLIAAARTAFAERGFANVSLDALAAETGLTRGALHHHFVNKAGLFAAVLRAIDAEIEAELDAIWARNPDPWEGFRACYHHYLDAALRPDRRRILFQDAPAVMGIEAVDILMNSGLAQTVAAMGELVAEGRIARADPEAMTHLLNGATFQLAFWAAEHGPGEDRLPRAHAALDLVFGGMTRP
jgi:AcrR family transcriptional regulator